jgi:hypothetical protein
MSITDILGAFVIVCVVAYLCGFIGEMVRFWWKGE